MHRILNKIIHKPTIITTIFLFLIAFIIFLILLTYIKSQYSYTLTYISSEIASKIKDVKLMKVIENGTDFFLVNFLSLKGISPVIFQAKINTIFTFTLPITLAIFISLLPYLEKKFRATIEVIIILISIHILYILSHELYELTKFLIYREVEQPRKIPFYFYQYLSVFTKAMIIRFEPFLLGLYIYLRFRKKIVSQEAS